MPTWLKIIIQRVCFKLAVIIYPSFWHISLVFDSESSYIKLLKIFLEKNFFSFLLPSFALLLLTVCCCCFLLLFSDNLWLECREIDNGWMLLLVLLFLLLNEDELVSEIGGWLGNSWWLLAAFVVSCCCDCCLSWALVRLDLFLDFVQY